MNQLVPITSAALPTLVAAAGEEASIRFLEFFAANIRKSHTRRVTRAAEEFLAWCADAGVPSIATVQPVHVATWIEAGEAAERAHQVKRLALAGLPRILTEPDTDRLAVLRGGIEQQSVDIARVGPPAHHIQ